MYDLGAWNDALEYDLNELEEILKGIELWISPKYLKEVEKWFECEFETIYAELVKIDSDYNKCNEKLK